jgi:hypothetical protein
MFISSSVWRDDVIYNLSDFEKGKTHITTLVYFMYTWYKRIMKSHSSTSFLTRDWIHKHGN